jgi:hypothetical protein
VILGERLGDDMGALVVAALQGAILLPARRRIRRRWNGSVTRSRS